MKEMFIVKSISDVMYTDGNSWAYNPEELRPLSYSEAQKLRRRLYNQSHYSDEFQVVSYDTAVIKYRQEAFEWRTEE